MKRLFVPYRLFSCFFRQFFSTVKTRKCSDKSTYLRADNFLLGRRIIPAFGVLFLVLLLASCKPGGGQVRVAAPQLLNSNHSRVTIYLETLGESGIDLSFRFLGAALKGSAEWQELKLEKIRVNRLGSEKKQLLLGVTALRIDTYTKLRLTVSEVKKGGVELLPAGADRQMELILTTPLVLTPDSSRCLFIEWHSLAAPLANGDFFATFSARPQRRPQITDLVTVLCRDLATVYQISPDKNRVMAALGLPQKVGEIAFDSRRRRFYAVATADRTLLKFDAVTNRLLDTMAMPQAVAPKSLVLSLDGRYAYVSDTPANRIVKIDLESGFVERETGHYLRPGRLFYFSGIKRDLLAVLAPSESVVYLLDAESLKTCFILPVNGRPAGIARVKKYLYVSDFSSDRVALYSLENGRLLSLIRVGRAPFDLVADSNRVYVSVAKESYLALLMPPQVTPTRRIRCRLRPESLAISRNWRKIYVAGQNVDQVDVIDLQAGTDLGVIPLPGHPDQIVLWESR